MGGSGISGDVVAAAFNDELPVPVTVLKQYRVPAFVGPETLAFAVSYSGDTEETVSMARAAGSAARRSSRSRAAARWPSSRRAPTDCTFRARTASCPRAAIGALVAPLAVTLFRMGLAPGAHAVLVRAQEQLARRRDHASRRSKATRTRARELARRIGRTIPSDLWRRRARRRCGVPLEVRREREREGAGVLERVSRARPQRDLRLGPARRRDTPAHHPRRAAARLRARAARPPLRDHPRDHRGGGAPGALRRGGRRGPPRATARPHVRRRLGAAATSRSTTTSIPARSTPSST